MKTDSTENSLVGSRTTQKHGIGGNEETENSLDKKQKSILVIDTPNDCYECPCYDHEGGICQASHNWKTDRENGCPLSHPLKRVSNDFYIYDRKYLFDHLEREIDLLKGTKAFEEFMKAREEK